jgi:HK97 family phage portal protein
MRIIDKIFGTPRIVTDLQNQVKALQRTSMGMTLNASTSIFPNYQVLENIDTYLTIDDIYSIISFLSETAARVTMYGYEIIDNNSMKSYKKFGQDTIQGKYYRRKAMYDLPENDKFVEFLDSISYEQKIQFYSILYITGELFLYKEVLEFGPNAGKINLHCLNNQNVTVVISEDFPQRIIGYKYFDVGFEGVFIPEEVIHVKYFNPSFVNGSQWRGFSPLQALSKRLTRINASMDATVAQVQNGGVPGIVYEKSDYAVETLGQRKNDFASYLKGSSNKGAPYFAAGEMGYIELGLSLADMNIVDLQGIDFTKLCNAYKLPEVLLNNHKASTDNNVSWAEKRLYTNSILPNIHLLKDAIMSSILPMYNDNVKRTIEIDLSDIPALQADMKLQADALNAMWWITPNEKRDIQQFEELDNPVMNQIVIDSGKMLLNDLDTGIVDVTMPEEVVDLS